VQVENLESVDVAGVGAGGSHSLILSTGGDVYAFGRGDHGRLGIGRRVTSYIPLAVHLHNESVVRPSVLQGVDGVCNGVAS
jgi:alpha-tubulin suppressor-like RCC1 family protein